MENYTINTIKTGLKKRLRTKTLFSNRTMQKHAEGL